MPVPATPYCVLTSHTRSFLNGTLFAAFDGHTGSGITSPTARVQTQDSSYYHGTLPGSSSTQPPLYTLRTNARETFLSRADLGPFAAVDWSSDSSSIPAFLHGAADPLVVIDGLQVRSSELLVSTHVLGSSRKFRVPGYTDTFKWKKTSPTVWQCFAPDRSLIATLEILNKIHLTMYAPATPTSGNTYAPSPSITHRTLLDTIILTALLMTTTLEDVIAVCSSSSSSKRLGDCSSSSSTPSGMTSRKSKSIRSMKSAPSLRAPSSPPPTPEKKQQQQQQQQQQERLLRPSPLVPLSPFSSSYWIVPVASSTRSSPSSSSLRRNAFDYGTQSAPEFRAEQQRQQQVGDQQQGSISIITRESARVRSTSTATSVSLKKKRSFNSHTPPPPTMAMTTAATTTTTITTTIPSSSVSMSTSTSTSTSTPVTSADGGMMRGRRGTVVGPCKVSIESMTFADNPNVPSKVTTPPSLPTTTTTTMMMTYPLKPRTSPLSKRSHHHLLSIPQTFMPITPSSSSSSSPSSSPPLPPLPTTPPIDWRSSSSSSSYVHSLSTPSSPLLLLSTATGKGGGATTITTTTASSGSSSSSSVITTTPGIMGMKLLWRKRKASMMTATTTSSSSADGGVSRVVVGRSESGNKGGMMVEERVGREGCLRGLFGVA